MDQKCIDDGFLIDNPGTVTLREPAKHNTFCLIDVPPCVVTPFEILGDPMMDGDVYTRSIQVKPGTAGHQKLIDLANATKAWQQAGLRMAVSARLLDVGFGNEPPAVELLHARATTGPQDFPCPPMATPLQVEPRPLAVGDAVCAEGFGKY